MTKVYDKAKWHIDAGENQEEVLSKMRTLFAFLDSQNLLTDEGKEIIDIGIDSSVSIHSRMLTEKGNDFMDGYYDSVINANKKEFSAALNSAYMEFCK